MPLFFTWTTLCVIMLGHIRSFNSAGGPFVRLSQWHSQQWFSQCNARSKTKLQRPTHATFQNAVVQSPLSFRLAYPFYVIPAQLSRFHFFTHEFMRLLLTVCLLLWQLHPPSTTEPISNLKPNTSLAHPFANTCHSVTQAYCIECAIYI